MEDRWKPIIGFKGYKINECGDVKSFKRRGKSILLTKTPTNQFHLVSDTGQRISINRLRLLYSVAHGINPVEIDGFVVGSLSNQRIISKEEYFREILQKSINGRELNEDKIRKSYAETMQHINVILRFYETEDITEVAELINNRKDFIVGYMRKKRYGNDGYIQEIWARIQEKCIIKVYERKSIIFNFNYYLIRMVRSEVADYKKKASQMIYYDNYGFYQKI